MHCLTAYTIYFFFGANIFSLTSTIMGWIFDLLERPVTFESIWNIANILKAYIGGVFVIFCWEILHHIFEVFHTEVHYIPLIN